MYEILDRIEIAPGIVELNISAPLVSRKAKPGQFVIVRSDEFAERIPLSLADWDDNSVTVIVQDVGVSTRKICELEKGDSILNLTGPLGKPSRIMNYGTVAIVGGCFGIGQAYALARALRAAGNRVLFLIEARNKDWAIWPDKISRVSDRMITSCNDGSTENCSANDPLQQMLGSEKVDRVYAIGCTFMMMEITRLTPSETPVRVSLMPLMVDGTGMCGACRCTVAGSVKFGCVDGPEFDGHDVDWAHLIERMRGYLDEEAEALDIWDRKNWHKALDKKSKAN